MKRTYQPKKGRRKKRHGFLHRMSTRNGAKVITARRRKGRKKLSVLSNNSMLPAKNRLKNRNEINEIFKKGKFSSLSGTCLKFNKNNLHTVRIGFLVGKKYSNKAVERNRLRRVLRSASAKLLPSLSEGFDILIFTSLKCNSAQKPTTTDFIKLLHDLFRRNNLLK